MSKEVRTVIAGLMQLFPSYNPTNPGAVVATYERHLSPFSPEVLRRAADDIVTESRFFPSVSEFVSAAQKANRAQPNVISTVEILERWQELDEAARCGEFNPRDYEELAHEAERVEWNETAASIRVKCARIKRDLYPVTA